MWFGSSDGLNRYDGRNIKVYKQAYHSSLKGNGDFYGKRAAEDALGNIYFGGRTGLIYYNRKLDQVSRFYPDSDTLRFNNMMEVLGITSSGVLWFTDNRDYFYSLNINTKKLKAFKIAVREERTLFRLSTMDKWGRIWFCMNQAVGCFDTRTHQTSFHMKSVFTRYGIFLFDDVLGLAKNRVIFATYLAVLEYNPETGAVKELLPYRPNATYKSLEADSLGRIYVGSMQHGLTIIDTSGHKEVITHIEGNRNTPATNIFISLFLDRTGNLWMGCDGFGVSRTQVLRTSFRLYQRYLRPHYQFATNFIKCFYKQDNTLWFGTHEGGLHKLRDSEQWLKKISFPWPGSNTVAGIMSFDKNNLLLGTGAGIVVYNVKTGQSKLVPFNKKVIGLDGQNLVLSLLKSKSGTWYAACRNGLFCLDMRNGMPYLARQVDAIGEPHLVSVYQTSNGDIWAGSIEHGFVYRFKERQSGVLTLTDTLLKGNSVRCFYEDSINSILWMATEKGLLKYSLKDESYLVISTRDGLIDNYIYGILPGNNDELWLSTNRGLSCFRTTSKKVVSFQESSGLQSNEFNTGAYYKAPDGALFFGGINGFNSFYPNHVLPNPNHPAVALTSFSVQDKEADWLGNPVVLQEVSLPYQISALSFDFAALEFTDPEKNNCRYRLEGVDEQWVESGNKYFARYSGLTPGHYRFVVKAANNDGVWGEPVVLLNIHIATPWWEQWWFTLFAGLLITLLVFLAIRYFTTRKLKIRLQQLEAVNAERIRIAKDMHDDLGSGLSKIAIMSELLRYNAKNDDTLMNQVNRIADTASELVDNMGQIVWTMNAGNDTLENLLAYLRQYSSDFFDDTGVLCIVDFEEPQVELFISQQHRRSVFMVVKESLNNLLKHARARQVRLHFSLNQQQAKLTIVDDGVGFDLNETRRFGNGLINMRKRMESIGGSLTIESKQGQGTTIIISWTITNTHFM